MLLLQYTLYIHKQTNIYLSEKEKRPEVLGSYLSWTLVGCFCFLIILFFYYYFIFFKVPFIMYRRTNVNIQTYSVYPEVQTEGKMCIIYEDTNYFVK